MIGKKVLIIEDEGIIAHGIELYAIQLGYDVVDIVLNLDEFERFSQKNIDFDVALVDIMLNGRPDGFKIARIIKEVFKKPFIFVTSYADKDTLRQAKFLQPDGYIIKPIQKKDILAAIELVEFDVNREEEQDETDDLSVYYYKDGHKHYKIELSKVIYVESFRNYLEVVDQSRKHLIRYTLSSFLNKLPSNFLRVHRSFIVNSENIQLFDSNHLKLNNGKIIPIGKNYKSTLEKLIDIL